MNKLTKLLSVFVIAGAIGTGVVGAVGCSPKPEENGHTHNYTLVNDNNGKHHEHCDVDGCDAPDKAAVDHTWGTDDKCACGATKPTETETPATKYSITYNANGHGTAPAAVAEATALPATLPTLTADGWTFGGWYTDAACTEANKATAGATLTANITLYAKWTENQTETPDPENPTPATKYSITYNANGHGTAPATVTEATALPATLPTLTADGWTFGGWYTDAACTEANKATAGATLTANITLYAKWTENQTETPDPGDEDFVIPANVSGLLIEGVEEATITLSETKTSYTIDKSAITVYFATGDNADVKGEAVPADVLELVLTDAKGNKVESWEEIKKDGAYTVNAGIKEDTPVAEDAEYISSAAELQASVIVTISNPVKADSLAVKAGTLTQSASVQNKMSADWTYTVTRANGDVEDYTGEVTVTVDTRTVGEQTATLASGNLTGSVKVTITEAVMHTETYAANFSGMEAQTISPDAETAAPVKIFESANGNTKLEVVGAKIEANGNNAAKECDGKFFANRGTFNGATFTSTNTLQKNQRYFILKTEGAAELTIYWSRNNGTDERGVSVFNSTVANGDISTLVPGADNIARSTLSTNDQSVQKLVVNIPAAGTYWITSANNNNIYFYYMELTTEFEGEGESVLLEKGESTLAQIDVNHAKVDDKAYVQQFVVGDTFSVDEGYSVKGTFIYANTADKTEEALTLTAVTYWIGTTELKPGETVLTEELFAKLGENTVTVKYGNSSVTGSYLIFVDSAVTGVTGITASIKDTVNPVLPNESAKLTLTKADIEATIVGENANATVEITSVKYAVKGAEEQTEITESVQLGAGEYVIYVVATVTDATAGKSANFDATCELRIAVAGTIQDIRYTISADDVTAVGSSASTEEKTLVDNANGKIVVGTNCKGGTNNITVNDVAYSSRIQLGGTYKAADGSKNAIVLTIKEPCKIRVIYNTSSNGSARTLSVYNSKGEKVAAGEAVDGAKMVEYTISEAGTFYLGSEGSGINIWYIEIDYNSNNA